MFAIVHELPGRMRLRSVQLIRNTTLATSVTARLQALPGIRSVQVGARTGSLLILHDNAPGCVARLRAALGFPAPAEPPPAAPVVDPAMVRLADALLGHMAERLVGALATALI